MTPIRDRARVLDDISQERLRQETNLLPGILNKIEKGNTPMKPAIKLRLAALLLALILLVSFFALPGAVTALKKLFGYIPGVGPVDATATLRVLAEPVTATRDGFTITVESALLDSNQTVIQYRIVGPFPARQDGSIGSNLCQEYPTLRLADGTSLTYPAGEGGANGNKAEYKDTFGAVPAGQTQATLVLPCLRGQLIGEKPLDWEIPLRFASAPDNLPVYPVQDLPTPTAQSQQGDDFITLSLEQLAETPDGYYLTGRLRWQDPSIYGLELDPYSIRVVDSANQPVSVGDAPYEQAGANEVPFALNIEQPANPGPLQIIVDYVALKIPSDATLTLDFGANPQPGQTWEVNQDLAVQGHTIKVLSAEYFQESPQAPPILMLYLQALPEVLSAQFMDFGTEKSQGGAGSPNSPDFPFRAAITYETFPTGKVNLSLTGFNLRRDGPWSVTWTPPTVDPSTPPRQLAAPVTDTRDGYTLTVKNVVLTADAATATYIIQFPAPMETKSGLVEGDVCIQKARLRLADGREKTSDTFVGGSGTDTQMEYIQTFPAFDANETPVSLVISCIHLMPAGEGPQNWEVPLQFIAGMPPTATSLPVIPVSPGQFCSSEPDLQTAPPAGLGGKIASWHLDGEFGQMTLLDLASNQTRELGTGIFPALSPDGRQLAYRGADEGVHIRNLETGEDILVDGTIQPGVYNVVLSWAPDGSQIALTRLANENTDIYLLNADGTGLRPLVATSQNESFYQWSPDSRSIVYSINQSQSSRMYELDLQSASSREMLALPAGVYPFALSRDWQRMIVSNEQGVFITNMDDFKPTLLFDPSGSLGAPFVWSPDGQWLALSFPGATDGSPARIALLQPDTCQLVVLMESAGSVSSWEK